MAGKTSQLKPKFHYIYTVGHLLKTCFRPGLQQVLSRQVRDTKIGRLITLSGHVEIDLSGLRLFVSKTRFEQVRSNVGNDKHTDFYWQSTDVFCVNLLLNRLVVFVV